MTKKYIELDAAKKEIMSWVHAEGKSHIPEEVIDEILDALAVPVEDGAIEAVLNNICETCGFRKIRNQKIGTETQWLKTPHDTNGMYPPESPELVEAIKRCLEIVIAELERR